MFTGIIRATAKVRKAHWKRSSLILTIQKPKGWKLKAGDSISTDGVCLTVAKATRTNFQVELMPETLRSSTFGKRIPQSVNLEQSLKQSDLLGGHVVLGHVDAVGRIQNVRKQGSSKILTILLPERSSHLVAPKGSIAVDGISFTVVEAGKDRFTISVVDYTLKHTTLGKKSKGDVMNIEFDIIAKYLAKMIQK